MSTPPQVGIDGQGRVAVRNAYPWHESIKDLPGAKWIKSAKAWVLPGTPGSAGALLTILADAGAQVSPRAMALATEAATREDRRALAADESAPLPVLPWREWLTTDPWPHQKRGIHYLLGSSAAAIGAGMGPQPVDTPILTPKGWRKLGDLAPGDAVFGSAGQVVTVASVRPSAVRPVYRVTLSDGTSTQATGEHRWLVYSAKQRSRGQSGRVMSTSDMLAAGLHRTASRNAAKYFLPDSAVVQIGIPTELPIPPYAMGVLLGDGALGHDQVVVTNPEIPVFGRLVAETGVALECSWSWFNPGGRCMYASAHKGRLRSVLNLMGLTGRSETKFIPPDYLMTDPVRRLDLLRGLLDTDGNGCGNCRAEFSSASPMLSSQVAWLARSLGAVVREVGPSPAAYRRFDGDCVDCFPRHRVVMAFPASAPCPFLLEYKAREYEAGSQQMQRQRPPRSIRSIEPAGMAEVCCIELDSGQAPDALYLTDRNLIPTHNTGKTMMAIGALNGRGIERGLLVCPVATFGVFPRELRLHSTRQWHTENGQRRTRKGTIKKLSLPERWRMVEDLFTCGCGRPHLAIIGYESMVREPVASADLAALGVQAVIYDEVHRLKAAGGGASWTAKSWVNQVNCRWGMSGTLMPQGPWDVYGIYRALDPAVFGTNQTRFQSKFIVMGRTRDGKDFPKDVFDHEKREFSRRFHSIAYVPVVDLRLPPVTHKIESFELEPAARTVYDSIRDSGLAEISAAVVAAGGNPTPSGDERTVAPANAGVELMRFAQITGGAVTDDAGVTAVVSTAKAAALAGVLERVGCRKGGLDGRSRPEPVVVFCRFRTDLEAIAGLCSRVGLRYAEVSGSRKDGLDDEAKMNPDCDVLGAQIASGGVGVDFTRARVNVWWSVGFELWLFQQAQKRSHRRGQTRQVLYVYLLANNTIDSDIYTALARKENVVESCTWAYLRGTAEGDTADLPEMEVPGGSVAGEPVKLPDWLLAGSPPPREPANRELDAQAGALAAAGLEGF